MKHTSQNNWEHLNKSILVPIQIVLKESWLFAEKFNILPKILHENQINCPHTHSSHKKRLPHTLSAAKQICSINETRMKKCAKWVFEDDLIWFNLGKLSETKLSAMGIKRKACLKYI